MSLIVDEHREYLSDRTRLEVFRRALGECVRPGSVVADIGSGTGILGLLACAAGAARVYAIEATGMIEIAKAIAAANGVADRFHFIEGHSSEVTLPERVDVCVSDFVGRIGIDAGILEIYPAARARFLKPGGTLIPSEISIFVAPAERPDIHDKVRFWERREVGVDVSPAFEWAVNTGYPVAFESGDLLGDAARVARIGTGEPCGSIRVSLDLPVTRAGTLHGLAGWCSAQLSPGVTMTNSPLAAERILRRNVFLPLRIPVAVDEGDHVHVRLGLVPADVIVSWSVEVRSRDGASRGRQSHSTLSGMLVSRAHLRRAKPDFVPVLTPRGRARLTILEFCDGRRRLAEIEALVHDRHPDIFSSPGEAAAFVAEVVSVYST